MPYKDESIKKQKHKEYSRKHYLKTLEETKQRTKNIKAKEKAKWYAFKHTVKCALCGFSHIAAMDFHHEDPTTKEGNVHEFVSNGQFAKAYEEIKKCIVLCANCHRIHHWEDREQKKKIPKGIKKKKKMLPIGNKTP
jgi:hypothetical protein